MTCVDFDPDNICRRCDGTGRVRELTYGYGYDRRSMLVECPTCDGTGLKWRVFRAT